MTQRNITPADERIDLALEDLRDTISKMSRLRTALQTAGSPFMKEGEEIERDLEGLEQLLENGY